MTKVVLKKGKLRKVHITKEGKIHGNIVIIQWN